MSVLLTFKEYTANEPKVLIKAWNEKCVPSQQINGAKRMALTSLLGFPRDVQDQIFQTVSSRGWSKSPYTDELLASKKLLPGSKRISGPKSWQSLTEISEESLLLYVRHLDQSTQTGRTSKSDQEDLATKIAIAYNLTELVCQDRRWLDHPAPRPSRAFKLTIPNF